jgi:REP element-mobilizing transposase RayT
MPVIRSRGYLPHLEGEEPVYFVTFRLADSLPADLLIRLRQEREGLRRGMEADTTRAGDKARLEQRRALLRKAELSLDKGHGECHMRDPRVAKVVADSLQHFEGKRYRVLAWCVMPNHVHVVFAPLAGNRLHTIVHSWKSFSAREANQLLGRSGAFWQREYFDHLVRGEASLERIVRYVRENPRKTGLRDWAWVG